MDAVSNCITELTFHNERLPPVLNVVHPRPTDCNAVIKLIGDALVVQRRLKSPLPFVSFKEWFSILKTAESADHENGLRMVRLWFC